MAFYDWNHNGEKDLQDDYLEYKIYQESTKGRKNDYTPSGGGISNFGAVVATVGGLFLAAGIVALFGGGENTPVIITIPLIKKVLGDMLSLEYDRSSY